MRLQALLLSNVGRYMCLLYKYLYVIIDLYIIIIIKLFLFSQVILFLIIFALFKRMKITVELFGVAGKAIRSMPCLILQPFYTFFVLILFIMYWLTVMMFLSTAG